MKKLILSLFILTSVAVYAQPIITAPNGGETIAGGSTYTITWNQCGLCMNASDKIEYSTDNGSTWNLVVASVSDAAKSYNWSVPTLSTTATQCLIKMTNGSTSDVSNNVFTITAPAGINDEAKATSIAIYPNPAANEITVSNTSNTTIESVQLYNYLGEITKNLVVNIYLSKSYKFSVSDLPSGIYFVGVNNGKAINKIVVAH